MSADWPIVKLGDGCSKIGSGATPKGGSSVYLDKGEIYLIRSQNIYNNGFKPDGLVYITENSADKLKNVIIEKDDILLNITGDSVARVCLAKKEYLPARVNQHVAIIRPKPAEFDSRFLRYFLASPKMQNLLLVIAGAGATRNALTKEMIESLEVPKPPLEVQTFIADNLSSLDDKIELNHQINQTLESIAQAIFKSWFVDFEPVKAKIAAIEAGEDAEGITRAAMSAISGKTCEELDQLQAEQPDNYTQLKTTAELFPAAMQDSELGDIPEGWEVIPFSKLAKLDTTSVKPHEEPSRLWEHYSIPAFDVYEAPVLELGSEIKSNKYKVNPTSILSSKLNPNTPRTWWPDVEYETSAICSTEFMQFIPTDESQRAFVFGLITSDPFQSGIKQRVTGSTGSRQRAQPSAVAEMDVVKPKEELVLAYCLHLTALFVLKAKNIKENITLAKLRDTLLPKLLSGELSVDAAKLAEE